MRFLPWEKLSFQTNLTKNEVLDRLNNNVEPKGLFWIGSLKKYDYGKKYQGIVKENSFAIKRKSFYAAYRPFIKGEIHELEENKLLINIKIRMSILIFGLMLMFLGSFIYHIIYYFLLLLANILKSEFNFFVIIELIIALVIYSLIYLIFIGWFIIENKKIKKDFKDVFKFF